MSTSPGERPDELSDFLDLLTSVDGAPAPEHLLYLHRKVRSLAHHRLPANDVLRLEMDSEDLAQDTLLQLVQHAHEFRGTTWGEFFTFLRSVVSQQKMDRSRRQGRQKRTVDRMELANRREEQEVPTPSVIVAGREEIEKLRELIGSLPATVRGTLELRLEGRDYEEIARISKISEANARQRVSRALGLLKQRWGVG